MPAFYSSDFLKDVNKSGTKKMEMSDSCEHENTPSDTVYSHDVKTDKNNSSHIHGDTVKIPIVSQNKILMNGHLDSSDSLVKGHKESTVSLSQQNGVPSSALSHVASSIAPSLKQYEECFSRNQAHGDASSFFNEHYEHHHATSPKISASTSGELTVPIYFKGKQVFITGATGFIGKVLVEKLIRSCPNIECIYCLIRPKKNQNIETRLNEITASKLFDRVRKEQPDFVKKIRPVYGDLLLPNFGISAADTAMLEENVNVIFHSAATIRFDEPLRVAIEMNVLAVRKMLALSRKFQHLEAFLHVSTAYANCDRPYIEETVYPPPVEPQKIIDTLEWMDDEMLQVLTPKLMGQKPNTYTYTKQLAEHLLTTEGSDLPIAIVRPSIVGAAWREPFPGWIDNLNGASGIYVAAGSGILQSMKGSADAKADIVPVDIAVNIMITAAWYTAVAKPSSVLIYHATTGDFNPYTWGEHGQQVNKAYKQVPLEGCFRRPNVNIVSNDFLHEYWTYVSHLMPAHITDVALRMVGKKPRMVKLYNKLHRSIDCLKFFTMNEWQWANSNHDMLKHQLSPSDQKMFYFDPRPLHWPTYIENYCMGAKKYVLNEDLSGLPSARAHHRKLQIIRYIFNTSLAIILWRVLIAKSAPARNLWFFIVGLVSKFVQFFRITSTMHT